MGMIYKKTAFFLKWTVRIFISILFHPLKIKTILKNAYLAFQGNVALINFIRIKGLHAPYKSVYDVYTSNKIDGPRENRVLIVTNQYPFADDLYRNMFVHNRVKCYQEKGLVVDVFNCFFRIVEPYEYDGVNVYGGHIQNLTKIIKVGSYSTICIHFVNKEMFDAVTEGQTNEKIIIWIHGEEAQRWQRRAFNFSEDTIAVNREKWNRRDARKMDFLSSVYKNSDILFIFVSNWFKNIAEEDAGTKVRNVRIIHNVINENIFIYKKKSSDIRKHILSIRPYMSLKYANDLSVKAILELSKDPIFHDLHFTLYGSMGLFEETVEPLRDFENVTLIKRFLSAQEMKAAHDEHGLFLCPTRLDTQGVSMGEAMASGLVPVTSSVSAIPEFCDDTCGILVDGEDYKGLANGIKKLYENPDLFLELSENAAKRMIQQCGTKATIDREINIIKSTI